ncbi:hypothetical protein TMatcc_005323 [Talaromyces marneffei ATCC 18224]|uniref:Uncharacterized protein n=2 Tax=Talaromyces marneffei TaxID=37727 RepID=B6QB98_TALMQ|nr:uncharacterized protein EYB26_006120 [Talaromyces marneffei]EEA26407.1 conserved hypothetical protein [Talaromyces marneffei ATCC 18224]KAE8555100.1 hypothetical protein EYB25_003648 [Talaromyces marneffei]QGA18435.1 hypothetical protein EYB26_006120 [Talaromyces marneffei]
MAPIASLTEPLLRFVRDLSSAFISLSSSQLVTRPDALLEPSTSSPSSSSLEHKLQKRADRILSIPATYAFLDSSPAPGSVVGAVLGVVAGVVIFVIVLYQTLGWGDTGESIVVEEEISGRPGSRRSAVSRSRSNRPPGRRIVEEETVEVRERPHSRRRPDITDDEDDEVVVIEEEATTGTHYSDDVVEVEEEESSVATSPRPPRRRGTGGSYRRNDPLAYGDDDDDEEDDDDHHYRRPRR